MSPFRALLLSLVLVVCAGCSTHKPWVNAQPRSAAAPPAATGGAGPSVVMGLTLSGGGTRAAAFGLGVLRALRDTAIEWEGRRTNLLDTVGFISGVSGGSVLAAHFAAFGELGLETFARDFLEVDIESRLLRMALAPARLHRLTSPWYGRTHVLAEDLDALYGGRRLGDVAARPGAPELLVTATDLRHGAAFEFSPEQLGALCIDWREVPLSFAVAASAAVPLLLSPVTLHNHAGRCPPADVPSSAISSNAGSPSPDFRTQLREANAATFRDAATRPFIHLVDGGLSDNLGLRGLLDRFVAGGSISAGFRDVPPGSLRRLVLVVVNAERDVSEAIERQATVPTMGQVMDSLVFGAGARDTQVTLALLRQDVQRWQAELAQVRGRPDSPFAADAQLHVLVVSLRDAPDEQLRSALLRVPTSLALPSADVRRLQAAGAEALRASEGFQRLLDSFQPADVGASADVPMLADYVP